MTKEQQEFEERREVLRKLACFTAPTALNKNELPQSILDNLVEHVLYLQKNAISEDKITELIKSQFKLNFEFDEVSLSLDRLLKNNLIVKNRNFFSLEISHRVLLQKTINEKVKQEQQIFEKLENHIKKQNPTLAAEIVAQIRSDFQLFLTNFFLLSGAEAVQLIYGNPKEINDLIGKVRKKNIFELLPTRDEITAKIEQKEFCDFVNLLSDQEKIYLRDLLDRSLQYFTITVDKKCEALLTADFADWNLFIDTNFIYNLLGLNTDFYTLKRENTEKILELGRKANINFFVSPTTLEEFTMSVSRARELLLGDRISRKLYKIAGDATGNAILSAYYKSYEQHNISPRDFLAKTDNLKDVLKSYGIEEKMDYSQSIKGTKEFKEVLAKMIALTGKNEFVAEHDTFHYLMILKLRAREGADNTFRTNKSWFLTADSSLAVFDREVRKSEISFCIRPYQLRQILRPLFSRADDFEAVFIDFVTEPAARAFPVVSTDTVMSVLARITYFEKEFSVQNSLELATKILTNQYFINQLREFHTDENEQIKLIDRQIMQVAQVSENRIEPKVQKPIEVKSRNYWNFVNPIWLLWQLFRGILILIRKYKVVSVISGIIIVLSLIATDYALAWKNLKIIYGFFEKIVQYSL